MKKYFQNPCDDNDNPIGDWIMWFFPTCPCCAGIRGVWYGVFGMSILMGLWWLAAILGIMGAAFAVWVLFYDQEQE